MRKVVAAQVSAITLAQRGLVTLRQADACGLSASARKRLVLSGEWVEVDQFVYRPAGIPEVTGARLQAAVLATDGLASHWSAAWLLGLVDREPQRHEASISATRSYRGPSRIHRSHFVPGHHVTIIDGIACTTPERTLVDLAAAAPIGRLEQLFERALRLELLTYPSLASCFVELARSGRTGIVRMRELLEQRDPAAAPTESELETTFLQVLRPTGLPEPERQHGLDLPTGSVRVDFAYPSLGLVIEVDGRRWHTGRKAFERDPARRNELVAAGGTVLQFTWAHLRFDPGWVRRIVSSTYWSLKANSDRDSAQLVG